MQFVRQLSQRGNTVFATVRQHKPSDPLTKIDNVTITSLDVSQPACIESWADEVAKLTDHIDVLINNAGCLAISDFSSVTAQELMDGYTTNSIGPLLVSQQLVKRGLLGGERGSLIANITSEAGSVHDSSGGFYAYRTSKCALNMISKSMSIDLKSKNIITTLLHPGRVMTDILRAHGLTGLITAQESVAGMLGAVLESDKELNGTWHDYEGNAMPW
jgi:NAD(P)-dependent dehydrogenase (short-subunit alcohol dehydrogenase family)